MAKNNPAAKLARMRHRELKPCAVCGEYFSALKTAKYCSNNCRQKAHYDRHK